MNPKYKLDDVLVTKREIGVVRSISYNEMPVYDKSGVNVGQEPTITYTFAYGDRQMGAYYRESEIIGKIEVVKS